MPARFHRERRDGARLALVEDFEIGLLQAAHRLAVCVAHHHFELHQLRLRGQTELRRHINVRADADFIRGLLRRDDARAYRDDR